MGVKSFGWENRMAQPSPIHSWKLMVPCEVSALKLGASSLMRNDILYLLISGKQPLQVQCCLGGPPGRPIERLRQGASSELLCLSFSCSSPSGHFAQKTKPTRFGEWVSLGTTSKSFMFARTRQSGRHTCRNSSSNNNRSGS